MWLENGTLAEECAEMSRLLAPCAYLQESIISKLNGASTGRTAEHFKP